MAEPLVSIVIPAFNAAPWLAHALDSVLAQTHRLLEIIVVDDGSTDCTFTTARRYEAAHPDIIHTIRHEHRGAGTARNRALAVASGDYFQFLDADDVLHPHKIERQLVRLAEEPEGTVASSSWSRFYSDDLSTAAQISAADWCDYDAAADWLIQSWMGQGTMPLFSWLVPRSLIEVAGPWDETLFLNDDGEWIARVLVRARRIAFVGDAWGYYRSGLANSVSRQRSDSALRSLFRASELCQRTLLAHRNTHQARQACAALWQSFMFTAYPQVTQLVAQAEQRVEELGGGHLKPGGGSLFALVRDALGWKAALRMQRFYYRLRHGG